MHYSVLTLFLQITLWNKLILSLGLGLIFGEALFGLGEFFVQVLQEAAQQVAVGILVIEEGGEGLPFIQVDLHDAGLHVGDALLRTARDGREAHVPSRGVHQHFEVGGGRVQVQLSIGLRRLVLHARKDNAKT